MDKRRQEIDIKFKEYYNIPDDEFEQGKHLFRDTFSYTLIELKYEWDRFKSSVKEGLRSLWGKN